MSWDTKHTLHDTKLPSQLWPSLVREQTCHEINDAVSNYLLKLHGVQYLLS